MTSSPCEPLLYVCVACKFATVRVSCRSNVLTDKLANKLTPGQTHGQPSEILVRSSPSTSKHIAQQRNNVLRCYQFPLSQCKSSSVAGLLLLSGGIASFRSVSPEPCRPFVSACQPARAKPQPSCSSRACLRAFFPPLALNVTGVIPALLTRRSCCLYLLDGLGPVRNISILAGSQALDKVYT
eukprot:6419888-Amphidinium_carterae.1